MPSLARAISDRSSRVSRSWPTSLKSFCIRSSSLSGPSSRVIKALGTGPHTVADVVARHDQVLALVVAAADDDVGVGVAGVEMVDGDPVELGVEVALHLGEQVADEGLEVGEPGAVLGRDDEAELVRVLLRPVEEGRPIHVVA